MSEIFSTIRLMAVLGVLLLVTLFVLLAMPNSKLRELALPFVSWAIAALSVAYVVSPIDILPEAFLGPFGLIDDIGAVAVAIGSVMTAMKAGKEAKQLQ
jgi:uncharacterized membrane protein YkvA (DUF1232 family)